jgi:hypothetical protein
MEQPLVFLTATMFTYEMWVWYEPVFTTVAECQQYAQTNTISIFNQLIQQYPGKFVEGLWCFSADQLLQMLDGLPRPDAKIES